MPLNFSVLDSFLKENGEAMKSRTLLRSERYGILADLSRRLEEILREHEAFESEFRNLISDKIDQAGDFSELHELHKTAMKGVLNYFIQEDNVVDVHDLFRISRDCITARVLQLVEDEMDRDGYGQPPAAYTWIGLGSEGRDEQTMVTDQDNMLIFGDEPYKRSFSEYLLDKCYEHHKEEGIEDGFEKVTPKNVIDYYYKVFSDRVVERLHEVGFEKCTGNVMPSNVKWRGSFTDWKDRLEQRLTFERGIFEPLDVVIMTDARFITGEKKLLDDLLTGFFRLLTDHKNVMKDFVQAAVLMPTALSFFGNFKAEKSGDHKGMVNIKLHGWAPLILAVRMLALSNGIFEPNTLKRIRELRATNAIKKDMENDLTDAYLILVKFRILNQANSKEIVNHMDLSYIRPDILDLQDQEKLRKAMRAVEALQKYIQSVLLFGQAV
jgi:CBS domain-containing protein